MWGWLAAIVRGIIEPLIASWQTYQRGRTSQQRDDAISAQHTLEEINEARDRVNHPVVNSDWLQHGKHSSPDKTGAPKT